MTSKITLTAIIAAIAMLLTGCNAPRVSVPSSGYLISKGSLAKLPIHKCDIISANHVERESSHRIVGKSHCILFRGQAKEFIKDDLDKYVQSRFYVDSKSDISLRIELEEAYSYYTYNSKAVNSVPFVGLITSVADGFKSVPIYFIIEVDVEASRGSKKAPYFAEVEVNNLIEDTVWGITDRAREIYNLQIEAARKEMFKELDRKLYFKVLEWLEENQNKRS